MTDTSPISLLAGGAPELLAPAAVAARLSITTRTLERWRITGDGPPWVRLGPRLVRYPADGLAGWQSARTFAHRADELAGAA